MKTQTKRTAPKTAPQTMTLRGGMTVRARASEWDETPVPTITGVPRAVVSEWITDVLDEVTGQRVDCPVRYVAAADNGKTYEILEHRGDLLLHWHTLDPEDFAHIGDPVAGRPLTVDQMLEDALQAERKALEAVEATAAKARAAEEVARQERLINERAQVLARCASATVAALRQRVAAHASEMAAVSAVTGF